MSSELASSSSSFRKSSASKIDQLYEISYLSDESKIPITQMPIVNPYHVFSKPVDSFTRKVKKLIGSSTNHSVKEYVQASKFDSYQLPASTSEHLVTLSLPSDLPRHCLAQGYTHIHFGAIKLALTFHGRKGLPAFSRIALVDTRFVEYQHACIGTIQTTLNAGTIFVTFYPNFNMPLNDPSLLTALKAQIQIGGTPQVNTFQATFHYQMAYRVQNHSLDIMVPGKESSGDALFLEVDSNATPTCTYVPRQLSREELVKLLPDRWVTNYEQIHQAPVQTTTAPDFVRHENGIVEVKFSTSQAAQATNIFPTVHTIEPVLPTSNHVWYDVCNCVDCLDEQFKLSIEEDEPKREKASQRRLRKRYEEGDPSVGLLGEPSGKYDYFVLYGDSTPKPSSSPTPCKSPPPTALSPYYQKALSIIHKDKVIHPSPIECHMVSPDPSSSTTQDYQAEFPPLSSFEDTQQRTKHEWKIKNPTTINSAGITNTVSSAEATLNWQSENAVAQNRVLTQILSQQNKMVRNQEVLSSKVKNLDALIGEIRIRIQNLHDELLQMVHTSSSSASLSKKEAEMKSLKNQLRDLERQHKQQRLTTFVDDPWRLPSTPFVGTSFDPQPIPQASFLASPSLSLWAAEQSEIRTAKEKPSKEMISSPSKPSTSQRRSKDGASSSKAPAVLTIDQENPVSTFLETLIKDKSFTNSFVAPVLPQEEEFDPTETLEHLFMADL